MAHTHTQKSFVHSHTHAHTDTASSAPLLLRPPTPANRFVPHPAVAWGWCSGVWVEIETNVLEIFICIIFLVAFFMRFSYISSYYSCAASRHSPQAATVAATVTVAVTVTATAATPPNADANALASQMGTCNNTYVCRVPLCRVFFAHWQLTWSIKYFSLGKNKKKINFDWTLPLHIVHYPKICKCLILNGIFYWGRLYFRFKYLNINLVNQQN